jgi:hypothetical protein
MNLISLCKIIYSNWPHHYLILFDIHIDYLHPIKAIGKISQIVWYLLEYVNLFNNSIYFDRGITCEVRLIIVRDRLILGLLDGLSTFMMS